MQEIVRIHGNWCGPNWTAGKVKPAANIIPADYSYSCTDKLDCACKIHDIDVFERGGRTEGSDLRLANVALRIAYNPKFDRFLRRKALAVAAGMLLGKTSRR